MIVRCPECSTGFKLPADRVGPKGAKVRCTKCDHVFRVRIVDGEPEIFYKPGEEPDQSKASFSEFGNKTAFGGPHSFASEDHEDSEVRETGGHTAIGRPGDLKNVRSTPRKPLASVTEEEAEEAKEKNKTAPPMAAGIINKKTIKKSSEQLEPPKTPEADDEEFAGPGRAHEISEPDDATAIGKPVEDSYTPKATSFGLPAVGGDEDLFGDDSIAEDAPSEETSRTSFGFPAESISDAPEKGFGEDDDEDDDMRATAFGRPAFGGEESDAEEDEPQFEENPKGTLFGLPAVGGGDDEEDVQPEPAADEAPSEDGLDLFDEDPQEPAEEFDDDPFAGAFEDKIDESPAVSVDESLKDDDPFDFDEDESDDFDAAFAPDDSFDPNAGIDVPDASNGDARDEADDDYDESFFSGGGGGSDFGDARELVDPAFGEEGPSFDPDAGEPVDEEAPGAGTGPAEFEFDEGPAEGIDLVMETSPPPAAERERAKSQAPSKDRKSKGKKSKTSRKKTSTAAGSRAVASGPDAASGLQKFMNFVLIVMIVITAFVGVVLYRTGGVIDFGRFDHMLEIVIEGKSFEPRPEWGIEKRTANDVQPLASANVFAFETAVKEGEAFVVRGEIENQGTTGYGSVKVRVSLVGPDGSILDDTTVPGGTVVDPKKLEDLAAGEFEDAVERQMSNVDAGKSIPFVAIFDEMPVNSMDELDILVEVTEKTEIPTEAK